MRSLKLLAAAAQEIPLWRELWLYFYETYYGNDVYYPNLDIDTAQMMNIKLIILGVCVGLAVAAFGAVYNKRVLGGFVRKLLRNECLSEESAKTLSELGVMKNYAIRNAVRKSVNLRRVVRCKEEEEFLAEQKKSREEYDEKRKNDPSLPKFKEETFEIDTENDHFYIPEDIKYMADVKFESKGTTLLGAVVFTLIMLVSYFVILYFLPDILELIDSFVGSFSGGGKGNILT